MATPGVPASKVAGPKGTLYLVAFRMLAVDRDVAPSKEALAFLLDAS